MVDFSIFEGPIVNDEKFPLPYIKLKKTDYHPKPHDLYVPPKGFENGEVYYLGDGNFYMGNGIYHSKNDNVTEEELKKRFVCI